jgi:condensin complex subunit 2
MNDDAAEKASRRKSAHFGDLGVSRKEADAEKSTGGGQGKRVASSTMAVQNGLNSSTTGRDKVRKRLSAVGAGAPAPVALEVNSTKFEEWMKLATDNVRIETLSQGHMY